MCNLHFLKMNKDKHKRLLPTVEFLGNVMCTAYSGQHQLKLVFYLPNAKEAKYVTRNLTNNKRALENNHKVLFTGTHVIQVFETKC